MAELLVKIDYQGNTSMEVNGAKGPNCRDITKNIEEALGKITSSEKKFEYHLSEEQHCFNTEGC